MPLDDGKNPGDHWKMSSPTDDLDYHYRAVRKFTNQLTATATTLDNIRDTIKEMNSNNNIDQGTMLHLESRVLTIQREVVWLKQYFLDQDIGAS